MPVVVWNSRASAYFKKIYERIKEDSYRNAEKVRDGITKIVDSLPGHPEKYPPTKYKKDNRGKYRAFEKVLVSDRIQNYRENDCHSADSSCEADYTGFTDPPIPVMV